MTLLQFLGQKYILAEDEDKAPYLTDWRKRFAGKALAALHFGHLGDGNLHYNIATPLGVNAKTFNEANERSIHELVYAQVERCNGSISTEHGVEQLKLDNLRGS